MNAESTKLAWDASQKALAAGNQYLLDGSKQGGVLMLALIASSPLWGKNASQTLLAITVAIAFASVLFCVLVFLRFGYEYARDGMSMAHALNAGAYQNWADTRSQNRKWMGWPVSLGALQAVFGLAAIALAARSVLLLV